MSVIVFARVEVTTTVPFVPFVPSKPGLEVAVGGMLSADAEVIIGVASVSGIVVKDEPLMTTVLKCEEVTVIVSPVSVDGTTL